MKGFTLVRQTWNLDAKNDIRILAKRRLEVRGDSWPVSWESIVARNEVGLD